MGSLRVNLVFYMFSCSDNKPSLLISLYLRLVSLVSGADESFYDFTELVHTLEAASMSQTQVSDAGMSAWFNFKSGI